MELLIRIMIFWMLLCQSAFSDNLNCVGLIPDKDDYIISSQLLRNVTGCILQILAQPKEEPIISAVPNGTNQLIMPLVGQKKLIIQKLTIDEPDQENTYEINYYDSSSFKIKSTKLSIKLTRTIDIDLTDEDLAKASYLIVKSNQHRNGPDLLVYSK